MVNIVGIFNSIHQAQTAREQLRELGIHDDSVSIITPGDQIPEVEVPKAQVDQSRLAKTLGGVVGGAIGAAGGMQLGAAASGLILTGVGPVVLIGLAGAALLGSGGAIAGRTAGAAIEQAMFGGLSASEVRGCEDALRNGRSVVVLSARDDDEAHDVRAALRHAGAELPPR